MGFLPSFRSRKRDVETDVTRLAPILNSVQSAAREAARELAGLRARLQETSDRAAFLFGNEMESEADGDPKKKAMLKDLEIFLTRGGLRKRYLERQVATLSEVVAILGVAIKPVTPAALRQ